MMIKPLFALVAMCQRPNHYILGMEDRLDIDRVSNAALKYMEKDKRECFQAQGKSGWIV
jgi:hypothetical protein